MNTNKSKLLAIVTLVFIIAVLLLGMNTAFSLSEIDVDYYLISERSKPIAKELQGSVLEKYQGRNMIFFNEQEAISDFEENPYFSVIECKKQYPSKLRLTIEERMEVFAFFTVYEGKNFYVMTDIEGNELSRGKENVNYADGGENFVIYELRHDGITLPTGDKNYAMVLAACQAADRVLGGIRTGLSSLTVYAPTSNARDTEFIFRTKEGVSIYIVDPTSSLDRKMEEGLAFYREKLSDGNKLFGSIYVLEDANDPTRLRISYEG